MMKKTMMSSILFFIYGFMYYIIEVLYRGYSHWSMFFLGGLCGVIIGLLNEKNKTISVLKQGIYGALIVTILEFIIGYIVNILLGWNIWDYSNVPFNFLGQICLPFTIIWFILSVFCIYLDDFLREKLFKSE
ncbi:putative ABC transporter permease [Clostridium sp. CAG:221]|uniref:putative ABC transporter permease n=1 Tax=Clostridium sp. CAG:221 TaxID=1262780 RepID=UPI00351C4599